MTTASGDIAFAISKASIPNLFVKILLYGIIAPGIPIIIISGFSSISIFFTQNIQILAQTEFHLQNIYTKTYKTPIYCYKKNITGKDVMVEMKYIPENL